VTTARLWVWIGAIGAAGVALYVTQLAHLHALLPAPHLPWWSLAVIFCLAESYPVHLHFRSETHSLSLGELGVVLGLFLATPGSLVGGLVGGAGAALILVRRQRPLKVAFNAAQFTLSSGAAVVAFRAVTSFGDPQGPLGWVAAAAGAATFGIVSVVLVAATITLAAGGPPWRELPRTICFALAGSLASASLAVSAIVMVESDRRSVWLLVVPAVCWGLAFRAYGSQRRRHEHLEFLYQTMRATQGAPEFRAAVRELLVAARAMLSAEYAEIVLLGARPEDGALRSTITADAEQLMEPAPLGPVQAAAVHAAQSRDVALLLPRGRKPHPLDAYLDERKLRDALVTALRREDNTFGLLIVGNRSGDVSTFNSDDRTLFETFAGHAGVLLENDRVKEQLRFQAFHDALTGLPNRTLFAERVAAALANGAANTTVLFVDLDDFKTINDTLGHSAGDELLVAVAERVRACVRPGDLAARLGGDEFGILLEEGADDAEQIAARLVEAMRAPFVLQGRETPMHASVGIASGASGAKTADELLSNADVAMYSAKASGKRRHATYEPQMHTRVRRRHELAGALETAVERDEIEVHFQPVVALATGRTIGVEALVRWQHPTRGLLAPGAFLPLAEERGLIVAIGQTVLRDACTRVAAWQRRLAGHEQLWVAVNLSPTELLRPDVARDVRTALAASDLEPHSLVLEITESGAMADAGAALAAMHELRRLGVRLALDDFGTGYSSLSHLRDFPIDILKIAKPFVDRLDHGHGDTTFTDAILRLAGALELDVVGEGIERPEQAALLRQLECGLGQGFHFSRPLHPDDAERYLARAAPPRARMRVA
jgi:diguanylate cyclase (GGDEF)-like protein